MVGQNNVTNTECLTYNLGLQDVKDLHNKLKKNIYIYSFSL